MRSGFLLLESRSQKIFKSFLSVFEVISGHRRLYAAHKLGLTELPTVTMDLDRNAAAIALVDRLATSPAMRFPIPKAADRYSVTFG